jgi:hypothetical protein
LKSAAEVPSILTIHQTAPGQYVLRAGDLKYRPLIVAVSKMLEDAKSLILITPGDVKVIQVANGAVPQPEPETEPEGELTEEMAQAIREQEELPLLVQSGTTESEPAPVPRQTRRRKSQTQIAGHNQPCGRCRGTGLIAISLPGGEASETACAICSGTGTMRRYGARR